MILIVLEDAEVLGVTDIKTANYNFKKRYKL